MHITAAIVVTLPATIPTILIERGPPDTFVADLGAQRYAELPLRGDTLKLDDGCNYVVVSVRVNGRTPVLVKVRRVDA